jgi:hypothetical protein
MAFESGCRHDLSWHTYWSLAPYGRNDAENRSGLIQACFEKLASGLETFTYCVSVLAIAQVAMDYEGHFVG